MTIYSTPTGPIFYDSSGNDHRENIVDSRPTFTKRHSAVKLQEPAFESFRRAEDILGKRVASRSGWDPKKAKARAIQLTGSWRSFAYQAALYAKDSQRYASPYTSGHVQAVAIDVSTNDPNFNLIHDILTFLGWEQARSDEPWHYSYGPRV
jgi:hypothetical protein